MAAEFTPVNKTSAWSSLLAHRQAHPVDLKQAFAADPRRAKTLSVATEHVFYDYSRQLVTGETMRRLFDLAKERDLKGKIQAMFRGDKINVTERRAVGHMALSAPRGEPFVVDGKDYNPEIHAVRQKFEKFSYEVLSGKRLGFTGKKITNILAIGIGGSELGPEFLAEACEPFAAPGMRLKFVANVDGTDFAKKTADLDPEETLVVVESKTFTTAETMKNAETAKRWIQQKMGGSPEVIKKHFVAVSTAKDKVEAFGIDPENMFIFWDFVGGRYSSRSAVGGVPLSLLLEYDNFAAILAGTRWMDEHFSNAPFERNIPVICGLIDILNINFNGYRTRGLLPYSQGLKRLPAHTQQVEMESNGKSADILGRPLDFDTGEVVFGEPGTDSQHSYLQLFHQGKQIIPADFIGFIRPQHPLGVATRDEVTHHEELMANFFAQQDALAFGKDDANLAKNFPGNRPSSSLLLEVLNPFTAGILLALTEHRAAVKGFIWGINSFDQFGVELGKKLGVDMRKRMLSFHRTGQIDTAGLNPATAIQLKALLTGRLPE